jgi:hypothetical protein
VRARIARSHGVTDIGRGKDAFLRDPPSHVQKKRATTNLTCSSGLALTEESEEI